MAKRFYEELYGSIPTDQTLPYKFLQHVLRVISSEPNDFLIKTNKFLSTAISKTKIYNAICEMKNGKTPGPNGISVEFYEKFWHIIGNDFAMILNKFVNCRLEMEWKSFKQAYITLIYKKSDPTDLRNYGSISLLNVDYKIVSKVYANCISALLSEHLGPMKYAFEGRDVCDGLIFLRDVIDLTQTKKQDAYVLSIDFYKAFDCVDHTFLKKVLKCSGFSDVFCDRIFALFQNSETAIIVNGFVSNFFPINKGVRQGDPFSLYRFTVFVEPMFRLMMSNNLIDGVFIPGSNTFAIKYSAYADDVTLMLSGTYSISKAFDLLLEYEMATGLKINFEKSKGFFAAKTEHLLLILM